MVDDCAAVGVKIAYTEIVRAVDLVGINILTQTQRLKIRELRL